MIWSPTPWCGRSDNQDPVSSLSYFPSYCGRSILFYLPVPSVVNSTHQEETFRRLTLCLFVMWPFVLKFRQRRRRPKPQYMFRNLRDSKSKWFVTNNSIIGTDTKDTGSCKKFQWNWIQQRQVFVHSSVFIILTLQ